MRGNGDDNEGRRERKKEDKSNKSNQSLSNGSSQFRERDSDDSPLYYWAIYGPSKPLGPSFLFYFIFNFCFSNL